MNLNQLKHKQYNFYKSLDCVYCPVLDINIHFTSQGYNHLLYKSDSIPRNQNEKYIRLLFLTYVPEVIKNATEVYSIRELEGLVKGKPKKILHYGLVAEVNNYKIRVIIQRIGNGNHTFLSVMPHDRYKSKKHPKV